MFSLVVPNLFILVPLIPTYLSLQTYAQLVKFVMDKNIDVRKLIPLFLMVDVRRKLHRDWVKNPPEMLIDLLPVSIPYSSQLEKMGERRVPLPICAPSSPMNDRYIAILVHVTHRVKDSKSDQNMAYRLGFVQQSRDVVNNSVDVTA